MTRLAGLDTARPDIPDELFRLESGYPFTQDTIIDLDEIWVDILKELQDAEFHGLRHDSPGTYNRGCRGPLCRKSNRENARGRKSGTERPTRILAPRLERALDPVLEFYHTIAKVRIRAYQLELLEAIKNG